MCVHVFLLVCLCCVMFVCVHVCASKGTGGFVCGWLCTTMCRRVCVCVFKNLQKLSFFGKQKLFHFHFCISVNVICNSVHLIFFSLTFSLTIFPSPPLFASIPPSLSFGSIWAPFCCCANRFHFRILFSSSSCVNARPRQRLGRR